MTMQNSGLMCDVCGKYIGLIKEEHYQSFSLEVCPDSVLHCHTDKCIAAMKKATEYNSYKYLPEGPIRKVFEEFANKQEVKARVYNEAYNGRSCVTCGVPFKKGEDCHTQLVRVLGYRVLRCHHKATCKGPLEHVAGYYIDRGGLFNIPPWSGIKEGPLLNLFSNDIQNYEEAAADFDKL